FGSNCVRSFCASTLSSNLLLRSVVPSLSSWAIRSPVQTIASIFASFPPSKQTAPTTLSRMTSGSENGHGASVWASASLEGVPQKKLQIWKPPAPVIYRSRAYELHTSPASQGVSERPVGRAVGRTSKPGTTGGRVSEPPEADP